MTLRERAAAALMRTLNFLPGVAEECLAALELEGVNFQGVTVRIEMDATQFKAEVAEAIAKLEELRRLNEEVAAAKVEVQT